MSKYASRVATSFERKAIAVNKVKTYAKEQVEAIHELPLLNRGSQQIQQTHTDRDTISNLFVN